MKIDISKIVIDHIITLQNARTGKLSVGDLFLFYGIPIILSVAVWYEGVALGNDVFGQSISVFAIFSALLFSVQIALFGIFYNKRADVGGVNKEKREKNLQDRKRLIKETNTNISYLIVISCISVTLFLISYAFSYFNKIEPAMATFLYSHFMFTLLMIIKRVHALFQREYDVA